MKDLLIVKNFLNRLLITVLLVSTFSAVTAFSRDLDDIYKELSSLESVRIAKEEGDQAFFCRIVYHTPMSPNFNQIDIFWKGSLDPYEAQIRNEEMAGARFRIYRYSNHLVKEVGDGELGLSHFRELLCLLDDYEVYTLPEVKLPVENPFEVYPLDPKHICIVASIGEHENRVVRHSDSGIGALIWTFVSKAGLIRKECENSN